MRWSSTVYSSHEVIYTWHSKWHSTKDHPKQLHLHFTLHQITVATVRILLLFSAHNSLLPLVLYIIIHKICSHWHYFMQTSRRLFISWHPLTFIHQTCSCSSTLSIAPHHKEDYFGRICNIQIPLFTSQHSLATFIHQTCSCSSTHIRSPLPQRRLYLG